MPEQALKFNSACICCGNKASTLLHFQRENKSAIVGEVDIIEGRKPAHYVSLVTSPRHIFAFHEVQVEIWRLDAHETRDNLNDLFEA